jgi:predicted MPP superfamily phosphohydrolase
MTRKTATRQGLETGPRALWKKRRASLEWEDYTAWRRGTDGFWLYKLKHRAVLLFGTLLKATGFYKYGYRNALNIQTRRLSLNANALPEAFDGYRILHLSDLHLDSMEDLAGRIAWAVAPLACDLCVITGDFRYSRHGAYKQILAPLERVVGAVSAADGIYAVPGNHDTQAMSEDIEKLGIRLLTNERAAILRNGQRLNIIGVDDPHDYYTEDAINCLKQKEAGFRLLLAHTPELYFQAAGCGIHLYLCGHSHGGQICLPGGFPLLTFLNTGKRFYRGVWRYRNMIGHTSPGCGTSKIPVRFNCMPEVTLLTLR